MARAVPKISAKDSTMHNPLDFFGQSELNIGTPSLWNRILNREELRGCDNLEKLLAGCEIIAALDGRDPLAA